MTEGLIDVRVKPNSSQSRIAVSEEGKVTVYLNSPPIDGRANTECVALIAKKLKVPKSLIVIRKGEKGKDKTLQIEGMDKDTIIRLLKS